MVILHLGIGSFHRAHQAWYLHRLRAEDGSGWSLAAATIRPDMAPLLASLAAQDGAYTLETVTPDGLRAYERITSIRHIVPWDPELAAVVDFGARPQTRIISFTVTEGGYYLDDHHHLDVTNPDVAADLGGAKRTIYGTIAAILRERLGRGAEPVTLLNCDNLRSNGERFRSGLLEFLERRGDADVRAFVLDRTTAPSSMVDRITPRPSPDVALRVREATGIDDACPVMAEDFIQWVIEDDFCAGRPEWERVGAEIVTSVLPYEEAKIRILNASHSCIAWAGTLVGYEYIHEGTGDPQIRAFADDYVTADVIPSLSPRSTCRPTATASSTAFATRIFATPTRASRPMASRRSPASSCRRSSICSPATRRSKRRRCSRRCSSSFSSAGTAASCRTCIKTA
jgi:D-arabinitol 4-dehydrogenase